MLKTGRICSICGWRINLLVEKAWRVWVEATKESPGNLIRCWDCKPSKEEGMPIVIDVRLYYARLLSEEI
jgi:hypothetical protein